MKPKLMPDHRGVVGERANFSWGKDAYPTDEDRDMNTMEEKIAMAIYEADRKQTVDAGGSLPVPWDELDQKDKDYFLNYGRIAVETMQG